MDELWAAIDPVVDALEAVEARYFITGSVASATLGEPRTTRDADLVADLSVEQAISLAEELHTDYYLDLETMLDALDRGASFNVLHLASMFKVDIFVLRARPYNLAAMERRQRIFEDKRGRSYYLASAEDVILSKLDWYRKSDSEQQWRDVLGVFKVQAGALDIGYLETWAERLEIADLLSRARVDAGV
ncbi:MAG: hypothetical protein FJX76_04415 [Armatimonadetes bacterium]|nr:hypothetical protein [Armatimonadota bacterium]